MESALLEAADSILAEQGPRAVTLAAVGSEVGIARNSVYEYFDSREDLVGAVIEAAFRSWADSVLESLGETLTPEETVKQYARVTLEKIAQGDHQVIATLGATDLPDGRRARIGELHQRLLEPMEAALEELRVHDPVLTSRLLQGLIDAGFREIESGREPQVVIGEVIRLIGAGLGASSKISS